MATSTTRIQAAFAAVMLFLLSMHSCALAQGIASKPAQQTKENRISANNTVLLLLDHQTGLFQLVRDFPVETFKNNVLALAATAKLYGVPTILTTSLAGGPNGPLLPEIRNMFPNAPLIARPGQINAWDSDEFVDAVKATRRKKVLLAGIVTDVCVVFPTLSLLAEGYEVYVVVDASGTFNPLVRDAALTRATQAGAVLINWFAVACELQKDWRLPPNAGQGLADLLAGYLPEYGNLISSYKGASEAACASGSCTNNSSTSSSSSSSSASSSGGSNSGNSSGGGGSNSNSNSGTGNSGGATPTPAGPAGSGSATQRGAGK